LSHDDLLYRLLADARPAALPRALAEQLLSRTGLDGDRFWWVTRSLNEPRSFFKAVQLLGLGWRQVAEALLLREPCQVAGPRSSALVFDRFEFSRGPLEPDHVERFLLGFLPPSRPVFWSWWRLQRGCRLVRSYGSPPRAMGTIGSRVEAWQPTDLVVDRGDGGPIHPDLFSTRFARHAAKLGLASVRLHDIRHFFASELLRRGVHPKVVSEALGHASTAFTMDVYQHLLPHQQQQASAAIEAALSSSPA
jgi:hypothetical protein